MLIFDCQKGKILVNNAKETASEAGGPEILFLSLKCIKGKSGPDTCILTNTNFVPGKLKKILNEGDNKESHDGSFVCIFKDDKQQEVSRLVVENPFHKKVESFNENGKIESNEIFNPGGEIFLRIQYDSRMKWLEIWDYKYSSMLPVASFIITKI